MTSPELAERTDPTAAPPAAEWWRTAVIYQIYPRSFADSSGDGIGDLPGVTAHLDDLADLGVDAIWLSPFQRSPQKDAGYDVSDYCDVDPLFGTLADFDVMLDRGARAAASVSSSTWSRTTPPTSTSGSSRRWPPRRAAASARATSSATARARRGELPPNNWESVFGGPAWTRVVEADGTPGQWYLHLFDSSQPDFDWSNEEVREEFRRILRFWLDRGVDGFRVDVAHGLVKQDGLPDYVPPTDAGSMGGGESGVPYWGRDGVHEIYRDWHRRRRGVRRRSRAVRRGVAADSRADRALGASGRDAPGVQLRLPRDGMGCRSPARRHHRVARGLRAPWARRARGCSRTTTSCATRRVLR